MKRKNKKSFNWYGLRQRFSIRKYHFGAASVLIGTTMFLMGGTTTQAAETGTQIVHSVESDSTDKTKEAATENVSKTQVETPAEKSSNKQEETSTVNAFNKQDEAQKDSSSLSASTTEVTTKMGTELRSSNEVVTQPKEEKQEETKVQEEKTTATVSKDALRTYLEELKNLLKEVPDSLKEQVENQEKVAEKTEKLLDSETSTQQEVDEQVVFVRTSINSLKKLKENNWGLDSKDKSEDKVEKETRNPKERSANVTPKEKLEKLSQSLNAYFKIASEITRPETKELIKGTEDIIRSVNEGLQQPDLTDEKIQSLIEQGKQAERKLALAVTRENSGKRDIINGTRMEEGTDFRTNPTGLDTKRAYIVHNGDGSGLPAETYLYAMRRTLGDKRAKASNLVEVREAYDEAKVSVEDKGNGNYRWTITFNSGFKSHKNAFYWFTLPKNHKITQVLGITKTMRSGASSSIGAFNFDGEWTNKIKQLIGNDKKAVHGPAKGGFDFNTDFRSLKDVTNSEFEPKLGGGSRVQNGDPVDSHNATGYYYLGPLANKFNGIDWGTEVPSDIRGKADRNMTGMHENTETLYHFTHDDGKLTFTYDTHTDYKYAPLYYAAGMRTIEDNSAKMYFMARGLQEKPNAPVISDNNVGTVTVQPNTEKADKVEISYIGSDQGEKKATLTRNHKDGTWSSDDTGIEVSGNSFIVKKEAVKVGTQVKAKSYFGNSDPSGETIRDILKRTEKPSVDALPDGSVTVKPNGYANYLKISYTDEDNTNKTITANKDEGTSKWSVTKDASFDSAITINSSSGLVTIPATSVADNTKVKSQAKAKGEALSDEAEATANNEDRTPPTISVKDGTTWKQGNSKGELTLLADQVNGEIKLNVKIEDNQGGSGFEFSSVGNSKTVDYTITGGNYNSTSTTFSGGRFSGKDSDATALLTLKLNRKDNGEFDYPSTGFTVTIKARDNSPRQNWTTENSTPKLLTVRVKPRDLVSPTVKLKNPTDSNKESVLSDSEQNAPVVTVFRGAKFDVPLKVSDNGETGTVNLKAESGLPNGVSLQGGPVVNKTGATVGNEAIVNVTGKVAADANLGEHVVTLKVSDDVSGSVDKGNNSTVKFKVKVVDLAFEERGTAVNDTTRSDMLNLGENSLDPNYYLRTTDGTNTDDRYFPLDMKFRYLNNNNISEKVSFDKIGKHTVKARAYFPDHATAKELPTNPTTGLTGDTSSVAGRGYLERNVEFSVRPNAPTLTNTEFYGTAGRKPDVTVSNLPTASQLQDGSSVTVDLYQGNTKVASKTVTKAELNGATSVTFANGNYTRELAENQQVRAVVTVSGSSNSYTINSNDSNLATVTGRSRLNNLAEGKKIVQIQDLNRNGVLSEAEKTAIKTAIFEANKDGVLKGKSVADINISATGLITAIDKDNKVAELQIDPKTGVVTRFAHIRDDYTISFPSGTDGKIRPTDPGFEWSADGKSLIYKFDATAGASNTIINTNDILKKLTATPKNDRVIGQPSLAVVNGTDKANGENNRDNYRRDGSTGYFYHNNSGVNMLDIVNPDNYGGNVQVGNTANKLVEVGRGDINNGNIVGTTLGSDTISAANGARDITFNNVVKKADGTSLIIKQQLYLMPKYTNKDLLVDRGTTNADNTNVINVYFVPVDPTKPDVARSTTNNLSTSSNQANRLAENISFTSLVKLTDNYNKDDATNATTNTVRSKLNMWVKTGNTKTLIVENGVEKAEVIARLKKEVNSATYEVFAKTTDASGNKSHEDNSDGQSLGFFRVGYNLVARQTINIVRGERISTDELKTFIQVQEGDELVALPKGATVTAALETSSIRSGSDETKTVEATVNFGENRTQKITLTYKVLNTFPIARTIYDFKNPDTVRSGGSSLYYHNGGNIPGGMTWIYKGNDKVTKPGDEFTEALAKDPVGTMTNYEFGGKYNYGRFTNSPTNTGNLEYTERVVHKVFDITDSNGVTVNKGAALTTDQAKAAVKKADGSETLPEGTTYEWVGSTDTNTPGVRSYKVKVTLPVSQTGTEAQPAATQVRPSKTIDVTVKVKPTAPTVSPATNGDVTVTPANETNVNKVEVIYTPADTNRLEDSGNIIKTTHEATKIVAIKGDNNKWTITEGDKVGVTINGDTGAITLKDHIVKDGTSVSSTDSAQDVSSDSKQANANNGEQDKPTIGLNNTLVEIGKAFDLSLDLSDGTGVGVDDANIKVTVPAGVTYDARTKSIKGTLSSVTKNDITVRVLDKNGNKAEKTISIAAVKPKPIYAIKDSTIPNVDTASNFVEVPTGVTSPSVAWKNGQPTTTTAETTHKTVTVSAQGYTATYVNVPVTVYPKVTLRKVNNKEVTEYHEIVGQPLTSSVSGTGGRTKEATADFYVEFEGGNKPNGTTVVFKNGTPTSTTAGTSSQTIVVTYPNGAGTVEKTVTFKTYGNEVNYPVGKDYFETEVGSKFEKKDAGDYVKPSSDLANPTGTAIAWHDGRRQDNPVDKPQATIGIREENINIWYTTPIARLRGDDTFNYTHQDLKVHLAVKPQAPTLTANQFQGKAGTKPEITVSNLPTANQLTEGSTVKVQLKDADGNVVAEKVITDNNGSAKFTADDYKNPVTLGQRLTANVVVSGTYQKTEKTATGTRQVATKYDLVSNNSNDDQVTPQKPTFDTATVTSTSRTLSGTLGGFDATNRVVKVHLNDENNTVLSSENNGGVTINGNTWTATLPDTVKLRQSVAKNGETTTPPAITVENTVTGGTVSTTSDNKQVEMGAYSVSPAIAGSKHIDITVPHDAKRVELRFHNNQETGDKANSITLVRGADGTWYTEATRAENATVTDANGYVGRITSTVSTTNPSENIISIPLNEQNGANKLHLKEEEANGDGTTTYGKGLGLRVEYQPEAGQNPTAAGNWKVVSVTNTAPNIVVKNETGRDTNHRKIYDSGTTLTADLLKDLVTVTDAEDSATLDANKPYGKGNVKVVFGLPATTGTTPAGYTKLL